MIQPTIPADVRERVITAAVDLYEQVGRERFPTVEAVRRLSRAEMNAVSAVMKELARRPPSESGFPPIREWLSPPAIKHKAAPSRDTLRVSSLERKMLRLLL